MNNNKAKMMSIHYMRAITILVIVIVIVIEHSFFWFNPQEKRLFSLLRVILVDWTAVFVAISGFLFQHLIHKYDVKKFYLNKVKNLIFPYLFVYLITILILDFDLLSNFKIEWTIILNRLLLGNYTTLWFMPMIIVLFIFSPILYCLSKKNLSLYIPVLILCFLLVRRESNQQNFVVLLNNLLHYGSIFIIGMWFNQNFDLINKYVIKNIKFFICILCAISFIDYLTIVCFIQPYIFLNYVSLGDLEKLLVFFILIPILELYVDNMPCLVKKILNYIANISFPIFFLHGLFIVLLIRMTSIYPNMYRQNSLIFFLQSLCVSFVVLCLCVLVCFLFKKLLKHNSRYFIGY